jgi:hypothetical protein
MTIQNKFKIQQSATNKSPRAINNSTARYDIKMRIKYLLIITLATISFNAGAQNLPAWAQKSFKHLKLDEKYELGAWMQPVNLEADFNGDGIPDIATLIIEKKTKKRGLLILNNGSNEYAIFGAGVNAGNESDDYDWANGWEISNQKKVYETILDDQYNTVDQIKHHLKRTALYIYHLDGADKGSGGIIYWNRKKYIWLQQGE